MSVVVLGGLSMAPSLAATPDTSGTASVQNTAPPSERNPALADTGQVRASKIIGSNVYNDHDQKIGSIDDIVLGQNGQPDVVLKVNGKLHQVPWSKLQFGNTKENSDNRVILPGMSQDAFNSLPEFHYTEGRRG
jgi:sporulation protein YlmC with PRC-barrel domain